MPKNKVEFGISHLHVGEYEVSEQGVVTLGTPYAQKGAVSFTPEESSEAYDFYADNVAFFSDYAGGQITGDFTAALFDDDFKLRFCGYRRLADGGIAKVKNARKPNIYIAFQVEGDKESRRVILYNGTLGAIKREYKTIEKNKEVAVETIPTTFNGDVNTEVTQNVLKPGDEGYDTVFTSPTAPAFAEESE